MIAINVNQWISTRLIFLASVLLIAISSAPADEIQVTVAGTLTELNTDVDPYNLDGADFELVFVYDTEAQILSTVANSSCTYASSTFQFVEATYSFSNRPNGAADVTTSFGNNLTVRNAHDCSTLNDHFGFPQGAFDESSEFANLISGNGAGLSFGNNTRLSSEQPLQRMPAFTSSEIDSVFFGPHVFSTSEDGALYNFTNANLVSVFGGSLPGDIKIDGLVDFLDIAPFVELLTSGEFRTEADINLDGSVDLLDIGPFIALLEAVQ